MNSFNLVSELNLRVTISQKNQGDNDKVYQAAFL